MRSGKKKTGAIFLVFIVFFLRNGISSQAFCEIVKSKDYILEFNKVRMGLNDYSFDINDAFLATIEGAATQHADAQIQLQLLRSENLYDLTFRLTGTVKCECDVCLEEFNLPVDADYKLLIKVSETENYDDDEIIYITEKLIEYDLSSYLYDSLMLAVPQRKVCEMSGTKECNKEVITKLEELNHPLDKEDEEGNNPAWDKLKNMFNN